MSHLIPALVLSVFQYVILLTGTSFLENADGGRIKQLKNAVGLFSFRLSDRVPPHSGHPHTIEDVFRMMACCLLHGFLLFNESQDAGDASLS